MLLVFKSWKSETLSTILLGFLPLLFFSYLLGTIPAVLYTIAMELWFQSGLRARCGFLCTIGLSTCLGAGAGFLSGALGFWAGFTKSDRLYLLLIGAFVGLLVGSYLGRKQIKQT